MKIGDIKVWPLKNDHPRLKANGSLILDDAVKLRFTVNSGDQGLWVGFPGKYGTKTDDKGKKIWYPDINIVDDEFRKEVQKQVVSAYNEATGNTGGMDQGEAPGATNQDTGDDIPF